ncbi:MAG: putative metal-binding motif-containing protein, partial [Anaerolineae bacterium]
MSPGRRLLRAIVIVLLFLGTPVTPAVHGTWSNTVVTATPNVGAAECNETVTVTLSLAANPDGETYCDWRVKLAYNTTALSFVSGTVNPGVWASGSGAGKQIQGGDTTGWVRIGEGNSIAVSVDSPVYLGSLTFQVIGGGESGFSIITGDPYADTGFTDPSGWPTHSPGGTSVDQATLIADTLWYRDADGDGHGAPDLSQNACSQPDGYVADNSDCDDGDPAVNPGADEVCNGVDD